MGWLDAERAMRLNKRPMTDTDRQRAKLGAAAPLQSKGKPVEDHNHLPLFVAANEPELF